MVKEVFEISKILLQVLIMCVCVFEIQNTDPKHFGKGHSIYTNIFQKL
jgi:hypothetical protein